MSISSAYGPTAVDPDHPIIEAMQVGARGVCVALQVTRLVALLTVLTLSNVGWLTVGHGS